MELQIAALSIRSNCANTYWALLAKRSSAHFKRVCTYCDGVIATFLFSLKCHFPRGNSLTNAKASQSGSDVNETGI